MLLPVSVTFRDMEGSATAELEQLIRVEAARLERYYSPLTSCRVLVERPQRAGSRALYHVRIDLGVSQGELVVQHEPSLHGEMQDLDIGKSRAEARAVRLHTDPKRAVREAFLQMRRQLQDHARKLRGAVKSRARPKLIGRVTRLEVAGGFGFLETPEGREVYFHRHSVLPDDYDRLRVGTEVEFAEEPGEHGPQASTLRIRHPRKQARESSRSVVVPTGRLTRKSSNRLGPAAH